MQKILLSIMLISSGYLAAIVLSPQDQRIFDRNGSVSVGGVIYVAGPDGQPVPKGTPAAAKRAPAPGQGAAPAASGVTVMIPADVIAEIAAHPGDVAQAIQNALPPASGSAASSAAAWLAS